MHAAAPNRPDAPAEPEPSRPTAATIAADLLRRAATAALLVVFGLPLWPIWLVVRLWRPRPPLVPSAARTARLLHRALGPIPAPGLAWPLRAAIVADIVQRVLEMPFYALSWELDELLYGRALDAIDLVAPVFEISAARSGSTQLAHYLEDDPRFCAPNVLQVLVPYVWAWKLAAATLGRIVPPERVRAVFRARVPPAYLLRHEFDPYRTDTFEVMVMLHHLGDLAAHLGPAPMIADYAPGRLTPTNRAFWEGDFLPFFDRIARKTLLFAGPGRHLLIKGHFLAVATELARRYPDARFLTVLRAPDTRIRSTINFHRSQPGDALLPPVPWPWLTERALAWELDYCDAELDWYGRAEGPRRCVVRFDAYVRDLEGTMRRVYRECLDVDALPPHIPRTHAARVRGNYLYDRSLPELGIDTDWLARRLEAYARWCRGG